MRIDSLRMVNFRGFADKTITLEPGINVLIGANGAGKTSVLEALRVAISAYFLGLEDVASHHIKPQDIRQRPTLGEDVFVRQYPVEVTATGVVNETQVSWRRTLKKKSSRTDRTGAAKLKDLAAKMDKDMRDLVPVVFPVLAYYPAGRLWIPEVASKGTALGPQERYKGYTSCIEGAVNIRRFTELWKRRTLIESQEGQKLPTSEAIEAAILQSVPEGEHIEFNYQFGELLLTLGAEKHRLSLLSEGYRSTISLFADLATRMATLNPHLGERAVLDTPGVVLIDEVDLHLHPAWQRKILGDLRRAFPKVQFVVAAHAPQVLVGAGPGEIQVLRRGEDGDILFERHDLPPGSNADRVLTGEWFGLTSTLDLDTLELLERHRALLLQANPSAQEKEGIERALRQRLGRFADTSLEQLALAVIAELQRDIDIHSAEARRELKEKAAKLLRERRAQP